MNTNITIPDDLLARYVAGEATEEEVVQVKKWLSLSVSHEQELVRFQRIWQTSAGLLPQAEVHVDLAWEKVSRQMKIGSPARRVTSTIGTRRSPFTIHHLLTWRIAASVLVVIGLGWLGYHFLRPIEKPMIVNKIQTQKNTIEQQLPDGTKVFLNQYSTLITKADFNDENRTVTLQGEAYFEVKRDENRPFIIKANGTEIRVLGTSFNVKAYDKQVRVAVTSGKVQFSTSKATTFLVKQEAAIAQADTLLKLPSLNFNELAYRTRVFVFDKTNLSEVVASLREGYHADIQLSSQYLSDCPLTARFERETLDNTLLVIAETLHLKIVRRGSAIVLDGSGCK
ncbi:MAG: FecR domain-containing protein [Spirosomataceae bacterium]